MKSIRQLAYKEGMFSFWKGLSQPLMSMVPLTSLIFIVNEQTKNTIDSVNPQMSLVNQQFIGGMAAGIARLPFGVPIELLKTRAQYQRQGKIKYFPMIAKLYHQQGVSGIYRGTWAMALRDGPGWAIYFAIYQYLKEYGERRDYWAHDDKDRRWKELLWRLNSGGIGGAIAWAYEIPFDIMKTRQQAHSGPKPLTMRDVMNQIKAEGSYARLAGTAPLTIFRGYLACSICIPMYDIII